MGKEREYRAAVLIGRFQPFGKQHEGLVNAALEMADYALVLVGSAYSAPSIKNPWSFAERERMIRSCFPETEPLEPGTPAHHALEWTGRLKVLPIRDYYYSDAVWMARVQSVVSSFVRPGDPVALLGQPKDKSSAYLGLFPEWERCALPWAVDTKRGTLLSATAIRRLLFDVAADVAWHDQGEHAVLATGTTKRVEDALRLNVPEPVVDFLRAYRDTPAYLHMVYEFAAIEAYRKQFSKLPYPPIFVTTDAVVTCAGHVLVVRRAGHPGEGLLALPGGFVREGERITDAAIRELIEETRIREAPTTLHKHIVDQQVFDYPERSLRGRTITHAVRIALPNLRLPEVEHGSDAAGVEWMPLTDVAKREAEFYEDHAQIIFAYTQEGWHQW